MKSNIVAYIKIVGVSAMMLFASIGANKVYAQQLDSELVQMAGSGGFSFSGFHVSRQYEHKEQNSNTVTFDTILTDSISFAYSASWPQEIQGLPKLDYPNLQYLGKVIFSMGGQAGFACTIDTLSKLLLSVYCIYDDQSTNGGGGSETYRTIRLDSLAYTVVNQQLTATVQGSMLFQHLQSLSAYDWQSYNGRGISGSVMTNYIVIVDSNSNPSFSLSLIGKVSSGVLSKRFLASSLTMYPNPCKDQLYVSIPEGERTSIRIYDLLGRMWKESDMSVPGTRILQIDTRALPNGRYILAIPRSSIPFSILR
jgi:hypothetical protein